MIKNILKNKINLLKILPILSLVVLGLGASFLAKDNFFKKTYSYSSVKIEPMYAADFSDDKVLMGASHNVFVGKVLGQTGNKERGIGPETQFNVEIIDNIKGNLKGNVSVDQEGGYKDGVMYVFAEEDKIDSKKDSDYLLKIGSTYLFATRYNKEENWYTLNPYPTASKLLTDSTIDDLQLKTLSENDARVQELKAAYTNEIVFDGDIKNNNALNSYVSKQKNISATESSEIDQKSKEE